MNDNLIGYRVAAVVMYFNYQRLYFLRKRLTFQEVMLSLALSIIFLFLWLFGTASIIIGVL